MRYITEPTSSSSFQSLILYTIYEQTVKNLPAITNWILSQLRQKPTTGETATLTGKEPRAQITYERQSNEGDKRGKTDQRTESIINYVCSLPEVKSLLYCGVEYVPNFNDRIRISDDVWFKLEDYQRMVDNMRSPMETIKFTLSTYNNDIKHLHQFVDIMVVS